MSTTETTQKTLAAQPTEPTQIDVDDIARETMTVTDLPAFEVYQATVEATRDTLEEAI